MNVVKPFQRQGNFTVFDNAILDELMPRLSFPAWKVLCLILRKTIGWTDGNGGRKMQDAISYSQLRAGTGISQNATIRRALVELAEEGVILAINPGTGRTVVYQLNRQYAITVTEDVTGPPEISVLNAPDPPTSALDAPEIPETSALDALAASALDAPDPPETSALNEHTKEKEIKDRKEKRERKHTHRIPPVSGIEMPEALKTRAFRDAWEHWEKHLRDSGKTMTAATRDLQWQRLEQMGEDNAIRLVRLWVERGARNPFWDIPESKTGKSGGVQIPAESGLAYNLEGWD
jgi:hypothetical protein